ncbi:nucleoside hydrolase-like [Ornithodoros turicata]|uniref:nucleoside hydrolase-like n=1 Tax=Ornithodoros turicata TaxID=34597 RepID=UPI003138C6A7
MRLVLDRHLIIDTDCGIDDALAIMLALNLPTSVEAVTCVAGNTDVDSICENVFRVLHLCRRSDIPVYRGCEQPLGGPYDHAHHYHGTDGLGGIAEEYPTGEMQIETTHAAVGLVSMAKRDPGKYTLVLLGPVTNAAVALTLDPGFTKNLKDIFVLGGNVAGRGNVLPGAEFNFKTDPQAIHVLLARAECPITIVPWEAVVNSTIPWDIFEEMCRRETSKSNFFKTVTRHTLTYHDEVSSDGFQLGDILAVVAALVPDAILESKKTRVAVELSGTYTKGQLVQAWTPDMLPTVKRTVDIASRFDKRLLSELLVRMLV